MINDKFPKFGKNKSQRRWTKILWRQYKGKVLILKHVIAVEADKTFVAIYKDDTE